MSERRDRLRDELLALRDGEGRINARTAVGWARKHPKSELHSSLDWDDKQAAEEHRVWQVRQLIAIVIVTPTGTRGLISLSIDRAEGGYRPLEEISAREDLRAIMLKDAFDELERVRRKYEILEELAGVWRAADKARQEEGRPAKVTAKAALRRGEQVAAAG